MTTPREPDPVAEALPCTCFNKGPRHSVHCQASLRPVVAALLAAKDAAHDRRVTDLLEANNREVERRRAAEQDAIELNELFDGQIALLRDEIAAKDAEIARLEAVLLLADKLCEDACEACNQADTTERVYVETGITIDEVPTWSIEYLGVSASHYYDARAALEQKP